MLSFLLQTLTVIRDALVQVAADVIPAAASATGPEHAVVQGVWMCKVCGDVKKSYQALATHLASHHKIRRAARSKVKGKTCLVCVRKYGSREALMGHIHSGNSICLVNIMLFYPDLTLEQMAASDAEHACEVKQALRGGDHRSYSGVLRRQVEGPLKIFVIPEGHKRVCRQYPLYDMYLRDSFASREVDFPHVMQHMDDFLEEALELIPIDLEPEVA